jgi:hypothetical protein
MIESTPKSHNARVIDLDSETVALLRVHRRQQQEERDEWGTDYEARDLVVCHENAPPSTLIHSARRLRGWSGTLGSESSGCMISATRTRPWH